MPGVLFNIFVKSHKQVEEQLGGCFLVCVGLDQYTTRRNTRFDVDPVDRSRWTCEEEIRRPQENIPKHKENENKKAAESLTESVAQSKWTIVYAKERY